MREANCIRNWFPSPCRNSSLKFSWILRQTGSLQTSTPRQNYCLLIHPFMAYAGALRVLSASMRTHRLNPVQTGWVKSCWQSCWLGRRYGGSFQARAVVKQETVIAVVKTRCGMLCHRDAWIWESLWISWSIHFWKVWPVTVKSHGFSTVVF